MAVTHYLTYSKYYSRTCKLFDYPSFRWIISSSPNAELVNAMLDQTMLMLQESEKPIVHYRWQGWIDRMDNNNLLRSMSINGCSPNNAACECFFGWLKMSSFLMNVGWLFLSKSLLND